MHIQNAGTARVSYTVCCNGNKYLVRGSGKWPNDYSLALDSSGEPIKAQYGHSDIKRVYGKENVDQRKSSPTLSQHLVVTAGVLTETPPPPTPCCDPSLLSTPSSPPPPTHHRYNKNPQKTEKHEMMLLSPLSPLPDKIKQPYFKVRRKGPQALHSLCLTCGHHLSQ